MRLKLDDVKKLQHKKYRDEFGAFVVEGEHLVLELHKAAQHNNALHGCEVYVTEHYKDFATRFPTQVISEKNMALIADTKTPQGIVAVVPIAALAPATHTTRAIYLYQVQDPGNLGSIVRTLAWFGDCRCLLSPGSVDPFNPKVVRASMGAIFHVPIELDVELTTLPQRFASLALLDMHGRALSAPSFRTHDCYLFGNEARGVPRDARQTLAATAYTIPGTGTIESLNLATAVNICLYELNR
jgi:TrmH family RNA methyltransferase